MEILATHITDPGCPWAYSARPYHARLRWRFGDQLDWRLVMIGLTESAEQYVERGYTPEVAAQGLHLFAKHFGMPYQHEVKRAMSATSPACRALVLVGDEQPELVEEAFLALQFLHFTTTDLLEDRDAIARALTGVEGLDGAAIVARLEEPATWQAYEADRAHARTADGTPSHAQDRTAQTDGPVRYTAPTVIFTRPDRRSFEVGGFQPFEAYDTALANLAPGLERRAPAEDPLEVLAAFPHGLVSAEVAEVLRPEIGPRDLEGTRTRLAELEAEGRVIGAPVGGDARWRLAA